ncbi:MAG TPA: transcription antitermination factor NusB [Streptosporangiaceae bacterium]
MSARSKARQRALEILFEADVRDVPAPDVLKRRVETSSPPLNPYATTLIEGVGAHLERIDELLATYAVGWTLDRMPAVDRNILRIGAFELLWAADVPDGVAISESVALARELSTDESPTYVNGLLSRLQQLKPSLTL